MIQKGYLHRYGLSAADWDDIPRSLLNGDAGRLEAWRASGDPRALGREPQQPKAQKPPKTPKKKPDPAPGLFDG